MKKTVFAGNSHNIYNADTVLKESSDYYGQSLRVNDVRSVAPNYFSHFSVEYNEDSNPITVNYYRGMTAQVTNITTTSAATLSGKYFSLYTAPDRHKYTIWYNVDGGSLPPTVIGTYAYIEVPVLSDDTAFFVAQATMMAINTFYSDYFTASTSGGNDLAVMTAGLGETGRSSEGTSGFTLEDTAGTQDTVDKLVIDYNGTNPIYQGQELIDYNFDVYSGKFVKNPEVTIQNVQIAVELDKNEDSVSVYNSDGSAISLDVALSTRATESTQLANKTQLEAINTKLTAGNASLSSIDTKVSTAANQTTANSSLSSIDTKLSSQATAVLQTSGNASLSSIDTKTPALITGRVPVDGSGVTQPISAASLPLPTGAATSALQTTGNTTLSTINGKVPALVGGRTPVDGSGVTQPVSAVSLPLPSGAATSANQATEIASLSSIDSKLTPISTAANQTTANNSLSSIDTKLTSQATAANQATVINNTSPYLDFGSAGNLGSALNSEVSITNTNGYSSISFYLTIPTGATVVFEDSPDGVNWISCTLRQRGGDNYISSTTSSGGIIGSISGSRLFRVRVSVAGSTTGTVMGRITKEVSTLEGIENGPPNEFFFDVSRGKIGGINGSRRFARNSDIDTAAKETIWGQGGLYTFSPAAANYYISSSSAADTTQMIQLTLLDANYAQVTKTVTLVGQTKTLITGGPYLRINSAINVGSTDLAGNVYIYEDDTVTAGVPQTQTKIRCFVSQAEQNSGMGIYTVPAGKTAYIVQWGAAASKAFADVTLDIRNFGQVFRNRGRMLCNLTADINYSVYQSVPEKSDIKFEATVTTNDTMVFLNYDLILVDN
jgi:hypothetical protein